MTNVVGDDGRNNEIREVLAEIPRQLRMFRQPVTPTTRLTNQFTELFSRNVLNPALIDSPINNIPLSYLSPTPSPDELVIRQRGRRSMPIIWSPEPNRPPSPMRTPTKVVTSTMTLRSSPRKRLVLSADYLTPLTPEKLGMGRNSTPNKRNLSPKKSPGPAAIKKIRFEDTSIYRVNKDVPLPVVLKGMSHDQLIDIIQGLVASQPRLEDKVREILPVPDLKPKEEQLHKIKKAIYKSLPTNRLVSKTDSLAHSKASGHLAEFKKTVIEQNKVLYESKNWDALLDYVQMAWQYVRATPVWDNQSHNAVRRHCFKILSYNANLALRNGGIDLGQKRIDEFEACLADMTKDCEEIVTCYQYIEYNKQKI